MVVSVGWVSVSEEAGYVGGGAAARLDGGDNRVKSVRAVAFGCATGSRACSVVVLDNKVAVGLLVVADGFATFCAASGFDAASAVRRLVVRDNGATAYGLTRLYLQKSDGI